MDTVLYKLVEFINERKGRKKCLDIIPSNWISFDINANELVGKFMPPPYDDENSASLHSLIECAAPAPDNWPTYPITIRGGVKTYQEGLKRMKELDTKDYAFSTDEEFSPSEKAMLELEIYKTANVVNGKLWDVPELMDENQNSTRTTTSPVGEPNQSKKRPHKNKIKVLENKLLDEPLMIGNTTDKQGESALLFNDMIPVIKETTSLDELKTVMTRGFHSQSCHLTQLSAQLEDLKAMMKEYSITGKMSEIVGFSCPADKHGLDLPIKSLQAFMDFDTKLVTNDYFRDDMVNSMWRIASICAPMQQTVRDIFKKFISRDTVLQFTAVKDTGKKQVLSKTKFFSCVQDVVIAKYANDEKIGQVSTKDFEQAVGRVINDAKDWEGNRAMRKKIHSEKRLNSE